MVEVSEGMRLIKTHGFTQIKIQKVEIWMMIYLDTCCKMLVVVVLISNVFLLLSSCSSYPSPVSRPDHPLSGLALVGSRAALSFAFAFLQRAWRFGEDADLCSEVLQESLEALQSLPEATLFDTGVSSVWIDVVERTVKFLRTVVQG